MSDLLRPFGRLHVLVLGTLGCLAIAVATAQGVWTSLAVVAAVAAGLWSVWLLYRRQTLPTDHRRPPFPSVRRRS